MKERQWGKSKIPHHFLITFVSYVTLRILLRSSSTFLTFFNQEKGLQVVLNVSQYGDKTSDKVKENIRQGLLDEGHLHEIFDLSVNGYLSDWLTTEEARQELIDKTITKIQKESGLSTRALRKI